MTALQIERAAAQTVGAIIRFDAKRATKYLSPKETVKATRQGKLDRRNHQTTILVTFGRPNSREQKFIKLAKKAGEPFPIKKIQLRPEKKRRV